MTKTDTITELARYILEKWGILEESGGSWENLRFPKYDIYPRDYLYYADKELSTYLSKHDNSALINCISHLKRAADCQVDIFLHVFQVYKLFKARNLGFDKKLEYLNASAVFSSRTMNRFNLLRNKMEHEYEIPTISDIEVYFDLVMAFVAVLEAAISSRYHLEYGVGEADEELRYDELLEVGYDFEKPFIFAEWGPPSNPMRLNQDTGNIVEFARTFRLLRLLSLRKSHASDRWVREKIEEVAANNKDALDEE